MPYYVRLVKDTFVARSLIKANTAQIHEKYVESRKIGFSSLKLCLSYKILLKCQNLEGIKKAFAHKIL